MVPGDAADLSARMHWALDHPQAMAEMGSAARLIYERLYTPDVNYAELIAIYAQAVAERNAGGSIGRQIKP
jgi:glycosyltransferase involved in cell wall biosynthesis